MCIEVLRPLEILASVYLSAYTKLVEVLFEFMIGHSLYYLVWIYREERGRIPKAYKNSSIVGICIYFIAEKKKFKIIKSINGLTKY